MTVACGGFAAFSEVRTIAVENGPASSEDPSGTPMQLEVSMVTTVARPMSSEEWAIAIEIYESCKEVVLNLINSGKNFYDKHEDKFKTIQRGMKLLQGAGDIIGGIMKFLPKEKDPLIQKLVDLEKEVKKLGEKLADHFNEMKNFISEQSFFTNIMIPTENLTMYMRDCIRAPGDDTRNNFRRAYMKHLPLKMLYNLRSYLQQRTTNPLKLSMDAEKLKTTTTFEKWEDMICRVMTQINLLESFASGLFGEKNNPTLDRLMHISFEIFDTMNFWKKEYKKDNGRYWDELKAWLEPFIVKNKAMKLSQKADEIEAKINSYLTNDSLYYGVFNETKWNEKYYYICENENDQLIGVWNKGGCCAFIYRCRELAKVSNDEYTKLAKQGLENLKELQWNGSLQKVIKDQVMSDTMIGPGYGFYFIVNEVYCDPWIGASKLPDRDFGCTYLGPGTKTRVPIKDATGPWFAVVAFK